MFVLNKKEFKDKNKHDLDKEYLAYSNGNHIKSVLLIYKLLDTGGIETLIIRMIKWLVTNGCNVTLLLYDYGGELLDELDDVKNLKIVVASKNKRLIKTPISIRFLFLLFLKRLKSETYDLVYSFGPLSLLLSYFIKAKVRLSGVYHPLTYWKKNQQVIVKLLSLIDREYKNKIVFMSKSVKFKTEEYFNEQINTIIFPLPINLYNEDNNLGRYDSRRIVSIGRIVDFKTYNFYMIDIMERLIEYDQSFEFHIYGYGDQEQALLNAISSSKARNNIYFHGKLEYTEMQNSLSNIFCFVGMGTALIEACSYGIPGIPAKSDDTNGVTTGYFHELPPSECGANLPYISANKDVFELILNLSQIGEQEYNSLAALSRKKSDEFGMDYIMDEFLKYCNSLL